MSSFDSLLLSDDDSVRDMTTKLLVQEFLTVPEESFELRAYALEKVLPCLSVALEHLSLEISRSDKKFSPINWLAQYLYRNNPSHNKAISKGYVKSLNLAAIEIRKKIKDQEEKAKAAALAQAQLLAKLKEEEVSLFKNAVAARRSHFRQVLGNLYDRWVGLLWRDDDPKLSKLEIISAFQDLSSSMEDDPHLMLCIRKLVKGIQSDGNIDTKFFENTPNYDYSIDGTPALKLSADQADLNKDEFISVTYESIAGWTNEDLDKIFQLMIERLVVIEAKTRSKFDSTYQVPVIPLFDTSLGPFEWITAFLRVCKDFKSHGLDVKGIKSTYESLKITKILNEGSKANEIDNVFKHLSQKIVSFFGIEAYEALMEFMSNESPKNNANADEQLLSSRHQVLGKLFSTFVVNGENSEAEFKLIADALKSVEFLSVGARKLLADWIKENEINEWVFTKADLVKMSNLILQDLDDAQFIEVSNILKAKVDSTVKPDLIKSSNRLDHEAKCIADILALKSDFNLNIASVCSAALNSITSALEAIYVEHKALGTICLRETSSVKTDSGEIHEEQFLRNVAVTHELEESLLGARSSNSSVEMEVFQSKIYKILLESPKDNDQGVFFLPREDSTLSEVSFITVPILSKMQDSIGATNIKLEGKTSKLNDQDAVFIKKALDQLFDILNQIDYRNKLVSIVKSASSYEKTHANLDIQAYLISKQNSESVRFDHLETDDQFSENAYSKTNSFVSPFLLQNPSTLTELKSTDSNYKHLDECYANNKTITIDSFSYIPINGSKGEMIGILKLCLGQSRDQEIDEGILISKQLGNALSKISEETITLKSVINRELDAESIDEASRQLLLFPKLLLLAQREAISNISASSISELKSYKRPPKSVLFICKGVLYIFGKKPKELSGWNNVSKYINKDLLSEMIAYDPTRIQKKIRFKRLDRVFKKIQFIETGESSSPTYLFHSWLCINRELRRAAVLSRQRRADLFSQASDANSDGASLSDDDVLESEGDFNEEEEIDGRGE